MTQALHLDHDPITVLHVDDDEQMRSLFEESLTRVERAFTVDSVANPETVLERLTDDGDIECIVSDYQMPTMNGLELLRAVRAERPDLPFILLTGQGSETVASEAISAGLTDYFQKSDIAGRFPVLAQRIENAVESERAEVSYRELFKKAVDGLSLNEPESGAFVDANPAFRDLFGLAESEILAMGIRDIQRIPSQNQQETTLADRLQRATTEGTTSTEECCRRTNGQRVWVDFQFKPIKVKGRSLVLTQARDITDRKRYEQTLTALYTAVTEIVAAERFRQVTQSVLAAIDDLLAANRAAIYRHTAPDNQLEVVDTMSLSNVTEAVSLDPEHPLAQSFIEGHPVETEDTSVFEQQATTGSARGRTVLMPIGAAGVLAIGYDDAERFADDDREFAEILVNAAGAAFERIEKDRQITSSEEELQRQTDELQRLERVNATLRDLNDSLLGADTRDEVFEAVCAELSRIETVSLAWIGVPGEDDRLERRAWAGAVPQYLDAASLELEASEEPAVAAARTGSTVRVANTATDIQRQPWRRTALSHGIESVVAIPIEVGGVSFGVLSVLSGEQTTFSGRFNDLLSSVAASIGETLHAIEQRQGLQTGETVEVTFEIDGEEYLLGRLAAAVGGELDITGVITESNDTSRVFVATSGAAPSTVADAAASMSAVRSATVVIDDGSEGAVELHLEIPLLGAYIREYPVRIAALTATPDSVRAVLEVARPDDVRAVASAIQEQYPGTRLLAKRSQADEATDSDRLHAFRESLTPRQREVVHVAYLSGYFESPRRCTGEELGEKLGISSQAVYQHIRSAERQLFDEAFRQVRASSPSE